MTSVIECTLLGSIGAFQLSAYLSSLFSEEDWQKLTGPYALTFGMLIAVIVLWNSGKSDRKNRERQHAETFNLQKENSEKLLGLTAESIKASIKSTHAISMVESSMNAMILELKNRPCHLKSIKGNENYDTRSLQ